MPLAVPYSVGSGIIELMIVSQISASDSSIVPAADHSVMMDTKVDSMSSSSVTIIRVVGLPVTNVLPTATMMYCVFWASVNPTSACLIRFTCFVLAGLDQRKAEAFAGGVPSADVKAKVDKLIKEIDKCISYLEEA